MHKIEGKPLLYNESKQHPGINIRKSGLYENKKCPSTLVIGHHYAERKGFEPLVPARVQRFSRPPQSTTLASLRLVWGANVFILLVKIMINLN